MPRWRFCWREEPLTAAQEELRIVNTITENSGIRGALPAGSGLRPDRALREGTEPETDGAVPSGPASFTGEICTGENRIESEASIVIIGDVRHGARVTAKGNIIVLGELRGSVHAGVAGNREAVVAAMEMAPLQIRIADVSCHYGDKGRKLGKGPMVASVENCSICTKVIKKSFLNMLNFN